MWILRVTPYGLPPGSRRQRFHLWARNKRARGNDKYAVKKPGAEYFASRYAMRTMRWGGVIILVFVIFHLIQFTIVPGNPGGGTALNRTPW